MRFFTCLFHEHDLWLVGLAAVFCLIGSMITIRLLQGLRNAVHGTQLAWVFMGGVSTGATIWCTHFVAMIAYRPGVAVTFEPRFTGISLLLAILGSAFAIGIATRDKVWAPALGGALFGLTVSLMHYVGMKAFSASGMMMWSPPYIVVSVAGAVLLGCLSFHQALARGLMAGRLTGVPLMVASIVVLHFTGMAAMTIMPLSALPPTIDNGDATIAVAMAVAGVGLLVLGTGFATYVLDMQSRSEARYRIEELLEGNVDGMVVCREGRIRAANAAFAALAGTAVPEMIGRPLSDWIDEIGSARTDAIVQGSLLSIDRDAIPIEIAIRQEARSTMPHTIYAIRDLRARLAQEHRIDQMARTDILTGLPNRTRFLEWLAQLTGPASPHEKVALLSLDLSRFREINDLYGQSAGDRILARIGERLTGALGAGEFVARVGGDKFMATKPVCKPQDALAWAERLRDAIGQAIPIDGGDIRCATSIGIALWPRDATELSALINNADLAMYRARAEIGVAACFYREGMDEVVRARRRLVRDLGDALDRGDLCLHWQVQQSVRTGAITGYEALLRWIKQDGSSVSPAEFIPLAEQAGLIVRLGEWVLRTACREAASWPVPAKIAVNLSPVQLGDAGLPRLVQTVLQETGLAPERLELEITETAMIADPDRTKLILHEIKALGVAVAMDDFGTGYSSLSTLRAFPFDKIKLDRSFMVELDVDPQAAAIIRAVLALGRILSIPILAEGVETEDQLRFLRAQGCNEAQGFLLGRPAPIETGVQRRIAAVRTNAPQKTLAC